MAYSFGRHKQLNGRDDYLNEVEISFISYFYNVIRYLSSSNTENRVCTALENPGKPWNFKIKIQSLENPGI